MEEEYYTEIFDVKQIPGLDESESFDMSDINYIRDFVYDRGLQTHVDFRKDEIKMVSVAELNPVGQTYVNIIKGHDEWYYVIYKKNRYHETMYKCDQLDGLVENLSRFV